MTESAHYDVLVIGAGPAGLAAAHAASSHGARVAMVDGQARPGGQVWRHDLCQRPSPQARRALQAVQGVEFLAGTEVVAADDRMLWLQSPQRALTLRYSSLVLATGARELLLPFPGWTLPGVTGAGGAQALAKQGWPMRGKRVVVAGSGPLLLAAAATLRAHGAEVLGIYEQASTSAVAAFAASLWRWPARAAQAVGLRLRLAGIPYRCGSVVRAAIGDEQLRAVEVEGPAGRRRIDCDHLAVGWGLVPNVELAELLGCALDRSTPHPHVQVDELLRTSLPGVYAAGEACGIGGLAAARIEGAIAGHAAAGAEADARKLLPQRRQARVFAELLARQFALAPRVHALAAPNTLVCRCEDVPLAALDGYGDARAAKLSTRCGMGACQGRICGSALAELGLFTRSGIRPPLFPARLSTLALETDDLSPSLPTDSPGVRP